MFVVPNGVDESFITMCFSMDNKLPEDMKEINKPVIGFFGLIDARLDIQLLRDAVGQRKDWSFVFVGPIIDDIRDAFNSLCDLPNVYYLGAKNRTDFASYISAMDVCLIPIVINERTRNVLSLKLFEYTALGKPIVATDLPELRKYTDFVKISRDSDEFIDNIDYCLRNRNTEIRKKAISFASQNTWQHRAEEISAIIENHLKGKTSENRN